MPKTSQQKLSFNSGIMSPTLAARLDLEKAAAGCRILDNFIPRDSGAAFKRAGFEYLNKTKDSGPACLRSFNYSVNTRFQLELGAGEVRFWEDRARVHLPVGAFSTWSGTTTQYEIGTPVFEGNVLYRAASTHTPSGNNQPPSTSWTTTNIKRWAASTGYGVGDVVNRSPLRLYYVCTTAHTSGASFDDTKWALINPFRYWAIAAAFAVGDKVEHIVSGNRRGFRCTVAHTSGAGTEPGVGGSWTTRWENYSSVPTHSTSSKPYVAGDAVRVSTTVYICNANHTSSGANEPTDGGSPWVALTGIPAWTGASTSRAVGDWVFYAGALWRFKSAFTTASYIAESSIASDVNYVGGEAAIDNWTSSPTYPTNAIVSSGTPAALYVCIADHVTATTTEPGTDGGTPYWQKLANVFKWVTGTNYTAGEYVVEAGVSYLVLLDHTSGTFATDLAANKLVAADDPLELALPYTEAEAFEVNPVAINDQVWLLHPNRETLLLERFADTAWKVGPVNWDWPPMRDENIENTHTIAASATTGSVTLTSSLKFFDPDMVGGYMQIAHRREAATTKLVLNTATTTASPVLRLNGRWDIFIYGTTWTGTVSLQFSKDGATDWQTQRTWDQPVVNMRTISTFGTTPGEVYARLESTVTAPASGSTNYAVLEAADSRVVGLVKITGYSSPTQVTATVVKDLWSTDATTLWSEGAYSDYRGWPRAATVHEQRLILIGTEDESEKIRASRFDGFFDFTELTSDDGALAFVAASRESNALMWVESFGRILAAGSLAEEWSIGSGSEGKILTPTNPPRIERETRVGSCNIQALLLGDALVFIANDRQQVMEFSYSFSDDKYVKQKMTQLAEHMFNSGIKQIAASRQPDTVLYCVMNDGRLMSFTYDRAQGVVAWAQHTTDGAFESVSVIYGGELNADEVWVVVKRTINGQDVRYVEALHKDTARYRFEGTADEMCYCDSSVLITNSPASTTVSGLDHLEGKAVVVLADGVVITGKTVSGGAITLTTAASKIRVGLPFTAKLQGNWLDMQLQDGSAQDKKQRVSKVTVITHQSNGMEYHADPDEGTGQWYGDGLGNVTAIASRVTRPTKFEVTNVARHYWETNLTLRSSLPLPVNILAVIYQNEYFG